jgi:hypothetical protein
MCVDEYMYVRICINMNTYIYITYIGGNDIGTTPFGQNTRRLVLSLITNANIFEISNNISTDINKNNILKNLQTMQNTQNNENIQKNTDLNKTRIFLLSLAGIISGCTTRVTDRNASFQRHRWIPNIIKCYILIQLGCFKQAGIDILGI